MSIELETALLGVADRVVRGVNFLNDNVPGWSSKEKLSIPDLDLCSTNRCVLGQLAAKSALTSAGYNLTRVNKGDNYEAAINALNIDGADHGFDILGIDFVLGKEEEVNDYFVLNHMWVEAIKRTRKGKKVTNKKLVKDYILYHDLELL